MPDNSARIITRHMKRLVGLDANGVTQLTYQFISLFQYNIAMRAMVVGSMEVPSFCRIGAVISS